MLILITGLPGASKTLNTIKYVCEDDLFNKKDDDGTNLKNPDGSFIKRPVYYHNINQLTLPWTKLSDDEAKKPMDIPKGSIIIYDECQDIFPVLPSSKSGNSPDHYTYMNKHRHNGHDIILVTQHPKNLNTQLRRLVNKHVHYKRRFGTNSVTQFEFQKCFDEPEEHFQKQNALTKAISIDPKYFDVYKSAEVHTVKKSIPYGKLFKFGIFVLLTLCALGASIYFMVSMASSQFGDDENDNVINESQKLVTQSFDYSSASIARDQSVDRYIDSYTPRIVGIPHTAPIYDELTQPKSFPKISGCVYSKSRDLCQCYSQQGTRINTTQDICLNVVQHGYFDITKEDYLPKQRNVVASYHPVQKPSLSRPRSVLLTHSQSDRSELNTRPNQIELP